MSSSVGFIWVNLYSLELTAAKTAQNSPELNIRFIDSCFQGSVVLYLGVVPRGLAQKGSKKKQGSLKVAEDLNAVFLLNMQQILRKTVIKSIFGQFLIITTIVHFGLRSFEIDFFIMSCCYLLQERRKVKKSGGDSKGQLISEAVYSRVPNTTVGNPYSFFGACPSYMALLGTSLLLNFKKISFLHFYSELLA